MGCIHWCQRFGDYGKTVMSYRPRRALKKGGHMTGHTLWESQTAEDSSVPLDGVLSVMLGCLIAEGRGAGA